MKPLKLITSIAAGVCVFAAWSTRAQTVTNLVTFSVVTFSQGPTNDNGTVTTYGPTHTVSYNSDALIDELGTAINGTNGFTAAAKLVLITVTNGTSFTFAVIDTTNTYDLSSSTGLGIMDLNPGNVQITSGSQSDTTVEQKETQSFTASVVYNDTPGNGFGGTLRFTLRGLVIFKETKTAPVNGTYTDTMKGKISSMTGSGMSNGNPIAATGTISFSGSAEL